MWTEITRAKYARAGLRYASDMTDAEWALIEPFLPPAKRGGRPRTTFRNNNSSACWTASLSPRATAFFWEDEL